MDQTDKPNTSKAEILSTIERLKAMTPVDPAWQLAINKALAKEEDAVIQKSVNEVKKELSKLPAEQQQMSFSFLPVDMTRISPFFPMSKTEMGHRPLEKLRWDNPWGVIEVQGERLSIFDESVLLAVLKLTKIKKSFTIVTTRNEICTSMGVSPSKDSYDAIWNCLKRLIYTGVGLELWEGKGKERKTVVRMAHTMLTGSIENKDKLTITINPYFEKMFLDNLTTSIDMDFRTSLKGDITKALYRFYEGQSQDIFKCHIDKLCDAVNIDKKLPKYTLRRHIRSGIKELIDKQYLVFGEINKQDIVIVKKVVRNIKRISH
jgi:hypothetical protein